MKAILIQNNIVVNAIIVDSIEQMQLDSPEFCGQFDFIIEATGEPDTPWIGWIWDGQEFHPPGWTPSE
jgi:hypothetical protein